MDRALPGWAIDLIRDGVPAADLKARGDRAVWSALVRTAASAHQRGQDAMEWEYLVLDTRSHLGQQLRLKDGHRVRKPLTVKKTLANAWDAAVVWCSEREPAWTAEDAAREAEERAAVLVDLIADPDTELSDAERSVLDHATAQARAYHRPEVTLPRQRMLEATGLGLTALRTALRRLEASGLLTLAQPGRRSAPGSSRPGRAAVYRLATTEAASYYLSRGTRPVVPPVQTSSAPIDSGVGAPVQTSSAPDALEENAVVTLTLSSRDPQALADALAALARTEVQVTETSSNAEVIPDNVRPLTRRSA